MIHLVKEAKTGKPIGLEKFNDNIWYSMAFPATAWGVGRLKVKKDVTYFILT